MSDDINLDEIEKRANKERFNPGGRGVTELASELRSWPPDVLALVAEVRRLQEENEGLRAKVAALECDASTSDQFALVEKHDLESEVERLRAKVAAGERLRQVVEAAAKDWAWQRSELHPMYLQHQCDLERNPVGDEEPRAECLACYRITMAKWAEAALDAYREAGKDGTK